jgi:hypothetical protein
VAGSPSGGAPGSASGREPEKASIWIPVKLVVVPVAAMLVTIYDERDAPSGQAIGYWIGLMLVPLLISLIVVGFKPAKRMRTFSTAFCLVGLVGLTMVFLGTASVRFSRPEKTAQDIVKEAVGTKPIDDTGDLSDREVSRLNREFISDVLAARKKHDADVDRLQPALATLYTAQSFDTAKHMEDTATAVKTLLQVDGEMADKIQRWPQETKTRVDASKLDQENKEAFLRGFQKVWGSSEVLVRHRDVRSREEQWAAATIDLYSFAAQHAAGIKTKDTKIVIADTTLLSQFNDKFKNSRDLRKKLDEANEQLAATQSAAMKKLGVSNSDLGLEKK